MKFLQICGIILYFLQILLPFSSLYCCLGQNSAIADTPPQLSPDIKMAPPQPPSGETKVSPGGGNSSESDLAGVQHMASVPPSPSGKKSFFKKNIEDGMDK